jgi:hypothetical protein
MLGFASKFLMGWTAPLVVAFTKTTTLWHIDAGSGGRPPHQDLREIALS